MGNSASSESGETIGVAKAAFESVAIRVEIVGNQSFFKLLKLTNNSCPERGNIPATAYLLSQQESPYAGNPRDRKKSFIGLPSPEPSVSKR